VTLIAASLCLPLVDPPLEILPWQLCSGWIATKAVLESKPLADLDDANVLCFAGDASYSACACCHPAFFGKEKELAKAAIAPVCILPAKGDPMEDAKAILDEKPFADKCFFLRFDDHEHGFMAARGDYSKPEIAAAAGKGLEILANFFMQHMAS
jgi:hypothetical protein